MPDLLPATDFIDTHKVAQGKARPARASRVLVVDDHLDILEPLADYLGSQGFEVFTAEDGRQMRKVLASEAVDLVVLDVMLPDESGWTLCEEVARHHDIPVIMLTAMVDVQDRVRGLTLGADDYVVKPFAPAELLARILVVLRRAGKSAAGQASSDPVNAVNVEQDVQASAFYRFDGWVLDMSRYELRDPEGGTVNLNSAELKLLLALVTHPNTVLSRERLLEITHGQPAPSVFDRSIDTAVSRLRRKLEARVPGQRLIKTAWGDGYIFAGEVRSGAE